MRFRRGCILVIIVTLCCIKTGGSLLKMIINSTLNHTARSPTLHCITQQEVRLFVVSYSKESDSLLCHTARSPTLPCITQQGVRLFVVSHSKESDSSLYHTARSPTLCCVTQQGDRLFSISRQFFRKL